ncbi:MAG: DUF2490 domain-containing protein [Bryobacteraceae bacterium]|nr:DUF2490 domain-containing protein [Bryobacteraceae bacterium]
MLRCFALFLLTLSSVSAQISEPNANGWYVYTGDHKFTETSKWGLHLEGQFRRFDVITKPQQLLLRPGINYEVNKHIEIGGGYAFVPTYRYGLNPIKSSFTEHRLWQNIIVRNKIGKVSIMNRFRFEERFLRPVLKYENRFRYLIRATVPIKGPWYFTAYNEVFIPVKPETHPAFADQNRTAALIGYKFAPHWRAEVGYMYQPIWQRNGRIREDNSTLMVMLWSDEPFRKKHAVK